MTERQYERMMIAIFLAAVGLLTIAIGYALFVL